LRRLFIILLILIVSQKLFAQKDIVLNYQKVDNKRLHFGFTIGFNSMDYKLTPSMETFGPNSEVLIPEINKLSTGFHVSVISDLRLNDYFNLRFLPGISIGQRNLLFYDIDGNVVSEMDIESTYIDLPLSIKYKATRINNSRPYLIGGINVRNDMARNKEFNEGDGIYIKFKPFDIYGEIGVGIDFYLAYFKFSTEVKYSIGTFNNISSEASEEAPQYANAIDKLNSRMFMISLHFE